MECSINFAADERERNEKKEWRKEKKVRKEKLKTLSEWKNDLQKVINAIVRVIDYGQPCIATGNYEGKMNAGHYLSVGSNDTLRFHLDNIHIQSEHSNQYKGGDTIRYQDGIVKVYGKEYLDFMDNLKAHPPIKLTVLEVKNLISKARHIKKGLEFEELTPKQRISKRLEINLELGIYQYLSDNYDLLENN
jgi:hypothetical protein